MIKFVKPGFIKQYLMALLITLIAISQPAVAENTIVYTEIQPAFVVNYGGPGRLKYLKVTVTLMTNSQLAADTAEHHEPLVRNALVDMLSRQTDEAVTTVVGQEQLRQDATQVVKDLFQQEVGHPVIEDLLFQNFIYQK